MCFKLCGIFINNESECLIKLIGFFGSLSLVTDFFLILILRSSSATCIFVSSLMIFNCNFSSAEDSSLIFLVNAEFVDLNLYRQ